MVNSNIQNGSPISRAERSDARMFVDVLICVSVPPSIEA
jgi:hypothetical protein